MGKDEWSAPGTLIQGFELNVVRFPFLADFTGRVCQGAIRRGKTGIYRGNILAYFTRTCENLLYRLRRPEFPRVLELRSTHS